MGNKDAFLTQEQGGLVHFVMGDGQIRPAIIVRKFDNDLCNLQVFVDGTNDKGLVPPASLESGLMWATSVPYSADYEAGSWHWPCDKEPEAPKKKKKKAKTKDEE